MRVYTIMLLRHTDLVNTNEMEFLTRVCFSNTVLTPPIGIKNLSPVNNNGSRWSLLYGLFVSYVQLANRSAGFIDIWSKEVMWSQVLIQRYCMPLSMPLKSVLGVILCCYIGERGSKFFASHPPLPVPVILLGVMKSRLLIMFMSK